MVFLFFFSLGKETVEISLLGALNINCSSTDKVSKSIHIICKSEKLLSQVAN